MNAHRQLLGGQTVSYCQHPFHDQVARMRSHDMAANNLMCSGIGNQFHKTVSLTHRHSFAVTGKIELADNHFFTSFNTFLFCKSDPGNFR